MFSSGRISFLQLPYMSSLILKKTIIFKKFLKALKNMEPCHVGFTKSTMCKSYSKPNPAFFNQTKYFSVS